jgi:tripartite-type tricarboxylate transporter receptor subunit TctC
MNWIRIAALALIGATFPALGQDYPNRPIRIVVGYAAGGGNDIIVRVMVNELSKGLGQAVIVENMPGAQSIIAAEAVAKAAPDGYTLLMGPSGPMTINPATYSKLRYSPTRDFTPISMICEFPLIVTVDAKLPIKSVSELIAYAKANPGKSNYASSAGIFQITTEMFKQRTGTAIEMIPYKSSGESVQALIGGQVMLTIVDPPPATGPLKAGTIRGLAVTSGKRHPSWPDLPTLAEAGVPDMEVPVWTAFFAPAKTPAAIVARLQREVARVVQTPEVKERFAGMGLDPVGGSSEDLARRVASDIAKWTAVAKAANLKND